MVKYLKTPLSTEDEIKILKSEREAQAIVISAFLNDIKQLDSKCSVMLEALRRLADEKHWRDQSVMFGVFTAARMVSVAQKALRKIGDISDE